MLLINQQFIDAARDNKINKLKNLLSQGADIHTDNNAALRWSAQEGHLEVIKYLLTQGANIHANNDDALRWSAAEGHLEIVKFLVVHGANIHADNDWALRLAALSGHLKIVKFLIAHGADIHANDDEALKGSAQNGHDDVWYALSAFIQEEKLLVAAVGSMPLMAAVGSTGASSWVCGMPVLPAVALDAMPKDQHLSITKNQRSKI